MNRSVAPPSRRPTRDAANIRAYRWHDWALEELAAAKGRQNLRVCAVLPARNETATVGDIVSRLRKSLDGAALVDEIVVIDSDSDDATSDAAAEAGATVHRARDIRPDLGGFPGKGEAMWKSLFVTDAEILMFMDADLIEWDVHFVRGLLGPLLMEPGISLVKGFYDRPPSDSADRGSLEGGRVTELVARPLIAMHFPELSGLVQPLAGEWAIRRDHFASLSVPTGYAVELAALIDTERRLGASAIGQVDLGLRTHHHQPLRSLALMSTQIMAAVRNRLGEYPARGTVVLHQPGASDGAISTVAHLVETVERPPARSAMRRD